MPKAKIQSSFSEQELAAHRKVEYPLVIRAMQGSVVGLAKFCDDKKAALIKMSAVK